MTDEESEASKAAAAPKDSPPGDQEITTVPETDGVTEPAKPAEVTLEPSGTEDLEKYVAVREEFYKTSKEWDAKIRDFEIAIRRPYFHVRPLDDAQLGNWHKYLDFIEKEGGIEKVSSSAVSLLTMLL